MHWNILHSYSSTISCYKQIFIDLNIKILKIDVYKNVKIEFYIELLIITTFKEAILMSLIDLEESASHPLPLPEGVPQVRYHLGCVKH